MRLKKGIFGCIVWILFIGILITAMIQNIYVFSSETPQKMWLTEGLILGCIFVAVQGGLWMMRSLSFRIQRKWTLDNAKIRFLEGFGLLFLILLFLGTRGYILFNGMSPSLENPYYTSAIVGSSYDTASFSTLSNIYIYLLSILFSLLGNKIILGVYLQIVLQGITYLLLYFTVKNVNGRVYAFAVTAALTLWSTFFDSLQKLSPVYLLFFLLIAVIWYMTITWKVLFQKKGNGIQQFLLVLLISILTGCLCYLDMLGMCLLVIGLAGFLSCRSDEKSEMDKSAMVAISVFLLVSVISFFAFLWMESFVSGTDFLTNLTVFYTHRISQIQYEWSYIFPSIYVELSMGMLFLAAGWIVGYWLSGKDENLFYILLLAGTACCSIFVHGEMDYGLLSQFSWIVLIIVSVVSFCTYYGEKQVTPMKENDVKQEMKVSSEGEAESGITGNENQEEKTEPGIRENAPFVPIPNPLPLPKKHVHKEMDYGIEIDESQMHYDLEQIPDDDDYDLK